MNSEEKTRRQAMIEKQGKVLLKIIHIIREITVDTSKDHDLKQLKKIQALARGVVGYGG